MNFLAEVKMIELLYDLVVNSPGISAIIVFLVFVYIFRTTRETYGQGD